VDNLRLEREDMKSMNSRISAFAISETVSEGLFPVLFLSPAYTLERVPFAMAVLTGLLLVMTVRLQEQQVNNSNCDSLFAAAYTDNTIQAFTIIVDPSQ